MEIIHFANRGLLIQALAKAVVPAEISRTSVNYLVDEAGGYWIQPSKALPKALANAVTKLGGDVRLDQSIAWNRFASCWAEMLPVEPSAEEPAHRALLEWTDLAQLPAWSALLRRLGGKIVGWRMEPDRQRILALVEQPPFHAMTQPLPNGWRAFVEQSPRFWVEHGYQHPVQATPENNSQLLVRHDVAWESIPLLQPVESAGRFTLPPMVGAVSDLAAPSIPVAPRLVSEARPTTPTFWVLPGTGEAALIAWLQHADDRLVRQLQVAKINGPNGPKIVLLSNADADRTQVLLLEAAGYYQYLKLNNLYVPTGRRLLPALRRDVARRTYAAQTDHLVWLDDDGHRGLVSSMVPLNAFRPLLDYVNYHVQQVIERPISQAQPLFTVAPFVVKDRPAPRVRPKPVAPTSPPTPQSDSHSGLLDTLIGWVKGAWQITSAVTAPAPIEESKSTPDVNPPPPPPVAPPAANIWRDLTDVVRRQIHAGNIVANDVLADLARTGFREQRLADAIWCWQQVVWQSGDRQPAAAIGWLQCENGIAGAARSVPPNEWTPGQLAANILRWSFSDEPWPVAVDAALQHIIDHDDSISIKAAWLVYTALSRQAGNDELMLARARDRLFTRLLEHGLRLEVDVPAFLRSEDAERGDRIAAVRDWLVKANDLIPRWLGDRSSGLSTERLVADDRLERFGLARERINTVNYAQLMIGWGLASVGATGAGWEIAEAGLRHLSADEPVHAWLGAAFRWRIEQAGQGSRAPARLTDELQRTWRQLSFDKRFAVDRLRQASRILEPLEIVDAFEIARTGGDSPIAQLAQVPSAELSGVVENLLRRTRPSADARLPVLTQALRVAPQAGESLVRTLTDQLLLEFEPFRGTEAQWLGLQAGLAGVAAMQLPDLAERLADRWLHWARRAEGVAPGLDRTLSVAIPALQRLNLDLVLHDVVITTQQLLARPPREVASALLLDQVRVALAGGRLALGQDDSALAVLDDIRRRLFTQGEYESRERLSLALRYVESLRHAPVRVAIGRLDEIMHRLPAPTDVFATNAYYALAPLRLLDAMIRSAANEDLTLGSRVKRWLDGEEYAIRRRIHRDLEAIMESK